MRKMNAISNVPSNNAECNFTPKTLPFNEATYQSLLVLAENYRLAKPPRIRMCLQCLMSVFNINPPSQTRVRTHIQIGTLLLRYTENTQLALSHLQAAFTMSKSTGNVLAYFEAASLLGLAFCKQSKPAQAKPILRDGIAASQQNAYWHARLLLQLACVHHEEGDNMSARQLLDVGAELSTNCGSDYLRILFLLSKGMILLLEQDLDEVNVVLSMCGQLIDSMKNSSQIQVESHKVYFLTLQVAHLLSGGQVKSVKTSLKQLQQSIQEITALPSSSCGLFQVDRSMHMKEMHEVEDVVKNLMSTDGFLWLERDQMCILVYLVTVTYSMLAGYLDKAQKYTDKALKQIKNLKLTDTSPLLTQLELVFVEHMAQCHLVMCDKKAALQKITHGCRLCVTYPSITSITKHTTQMHTLLGMYSMSMNYLDMAEKHLQIAVKKSTHNEQIVTNMLNLAMVYMHNYQLSNGGISQAKQQELIRILTQINPDSVVVKSRNLKAASFYVKGMFSFFQASYSDAKRFLRETLKMANAQDLNRLTACALVLLGHIYLSVGNHQESVNMILPAMQLANKIPDLSVKLWASALLRDLYKLCGNEEHFKEYKNMYEKLASQLLNEHYTSAEAAPHRIINWLNEDLPPVHLLEDAPVMKEEKNEEESSATKSEMEWSESENPPPVINQDPGLPTSHQTFRNPPQVTSSFQGVPLPPSEVKSDKNMMNYQPHSFNQKSNISSHESSELFQSPLSALGYQPQPSYTQPQLENLPFSSNESLRKTNPVPHAAPKQEPVMQTSDIMSQMQGVSKQANIASNATPNPTELLMTNQRQALPHRGSVSENHMYHPGQQDPSLFASPHGLQQQQAMLSPKVSEQEYLAKLAGRGYGIGSQHLLDSFSNKAQQLQQQALLQQHMQLGHLFPQPNRSNPQHLYQHGVTEGFPQQSMVERYALENKLEMQLGQNLQQPNTWVPNQGHPYPPGPNFNWR